MISKRGIKVKDYLYCRAINNKWSRERKKLKNKHLQLISSKSLMIRQIFSACKGMMRYALKSVSPSPVPIQIGQQENDKFKYYKLVLLSGKSHVYTAEKVLSEVINRENKKDINFANLNDKNIFCNTFIERALNAPKYYGRDFIRVPVDRSKDEEIVSVSLLYNILRWPNRCAKQIYSDSFFDKDFGLFHNMGNACFICEYIQQWIKRTYDVDIKYYLEVSEKEERDSPVPFYYYDDTRCIFTIKKTDVEKIRDME